MKSLLEALAPGSEDLALARAIDPTRIPAHIAIIMDGNGRWAQARGLPRIAGHRRGAEAVRRTLAAAGEIGIPYLTLFGFSSENWKRPFDEVDDLMGLLRHYLRGEIAELHRNGVRLRVIGEIGRLSADLVTLIANAEALTRDNRAINLTVALSNCVLSAQGPTNISTSPGSNTGSRCRSRKDSSAAGNDSVIVPISPGSRLILPKPFSSNFGRETLATLSCTNKKTVSCASLAPRLMTST